VTPPEAAALAHRRHGKSTAEEPVRDLPPRGEPRQCQCERQDARVLALRRLRNQHRAGIAEQGRNGHRHGGGRARRGASAPTRRSIWSATRWRRAGMAGMGGCLCERAVATVCQIGYSFAPRWCSQPPLRRPRRSAASYCQQKSDSIGFNNGASHTNFNRYWDYPGR
jgi:hypothetical protein